MALSNLPHISKTRVGNELQDPMHGSIFEIYFTLPAVISGEFSDECNILTQQVTTVQGLDALQKTSAAGQQKFLGVDVSFLNPVLESTYADITIELNLNIRNKQDAWVLKIFKAWANIGYDLATGIRAAKADYVAETLSIAEANRDGTVWRTVKFNKVMLTSVTGLDGLDYTNNEARKLTVTIRADYWDELLS